MPFSPPNTFTDGTLADADQVNENFSSVADEINSIADSLASIEQTLDGIGVAEGLVKEDGSVPFTNPVTGVDPTEDYHLATKRYVDSVAGGGSVSAEWDTYEPSLHSEGGTGVYNLLVSQVSAIARYQRHSDTVHAYFYIKGSDSNTGDGGELQIELPYPFKVFEDMGSESDAHHVLGMGSIQEDGDLSSYRQVGIFAVYGTVSWIRLFDYDNNVFLSSDWLTNDENRISLSFTYEAVPEE